MADKKVIITTNTGDGKVVVQQKPKITTKSGTLAGSPQTSNKVDIVFVFDTTGSMSDKIEALLRTCSGFVDEARSLSLDPYFALIAFGDISVQGGGDTIKTVVAPTGEIERIKHGLAHIPRNSGFGNIGESAFEAVQSALSLEYRPDSVKVLILITDEPAHQHNITAKEMIERLTQREFLVFTVATSDQYYKDMAVKNGGTWKQISANTQLSDILDMFRDIAKRVTQVAKRVLLSGGSVRQYLALNPPKPDGENS